MKWRDPRTSNAMRVPSQHSLPLQELSLRQMGHREWCPPLQLQKPAMLFRQTGHIKRNDLDTCTPLSLIPGPSWLSISSFVFADLVAISFPGGKIAVTIGRCPLQSIAWLQGKLPLSFGIQALLKVPSHNPPKYVWIHLDTSMSTIVHRPLETSQAPRPHRLEWRFPEPAKETTWRCDPEQVLAYSTQAAQQACLVRTQQAKSGQKQRQKKQSRTWCCSQKEKNGTYKYILEIRGVRGHFVSLHNVPCLCRSCHFCKWVIQSDVFS